MNIIIGQFGIIIVFILSQSCYTVLERKERIAIKHQYELKDFPKLYNGLLGIWIKKTLMMDYGYVYEKLEFSSSVVISYCPRIEALNSEIYYGNWGTKSDSLAIVFDNTNDIELYLISITEGALRVISLEDYSKTKDNLINNYLSESFWLKE